MRNLGFWIALLLATAGSAFAQVDVSVALEQNQFLPGEAIPAKIRIANHSGQTIHFGKDNWLTFSIEAADGFIVLKNGEAPIAHDFDLESSRVATLRADLGPYFNVSKLGRYSITATANIDQWNQEMASAPRKFEVISGTRIWEQSFGVPSGTNQSEPEVRKYVLQQANYLKHIKLYLRVTDAEESRVIRVFPIGPMISFSRPQTLLDKLSNLHLLYQDGSRTFHYTVVNPDGEIVTRQTHLYTEAPPRLRMDKSGNIIIVGGARQFADSDFPPRVTASTSLPEIPPPTKSSNLPDDPLPPTP